MNHIMGKKVSKKNEEKLKIYLNKTNAVNANIKPGNKQDKNNSSGAQNGKDVRARSGN
jgi:hypothetical protein